MNDKIFGVETKPFQPVILLIVGLLAYAGPIAAGTIYFQNLYFGINELRKDVNELAASIDPVASARLQGEVNRIRKRQDDILLGKTVQQTAMKIDVTRMEKSIDSLNNRYGTINAKLFDIRRELDRVLDRHPELQSGRK